ILPRLGLHAVAAREGTIDEYQLQLDTQRISGVYQRLGYFAVDVKTKADNVPFSKVRDVVPLKEGSQFDYDAYDATKQPLLELLMDNGYAHARVEGTVIADRAHAKATLRFVVDPGPASKFGEIEIQGVTDPMLVAALRARLKWSTGDPFSHKA